jgi:hypothetical protein
VNLSHLADNVVTFMVAPALAQPPQRALQRQLQAIAVNLACTTAGGSYSATPECNTVGPEGGQLLVEKAVEAINGLWKTEQ